MTQTVLASDQFLGIERYHCDTTKRRAKEMAGRFDWTNLGWALRHFFRLIAAIWRHRPDAVYLPLTATWTAFWRDSTLAFIAGLSGAKLIGHVHGGWFDRVLAARGARAVLVRACVTQYDTLLTLGERWRTLFAEYGYAGRLFVVPPAPRRDLFVQALSYERVYDNKVPVGLHVGHVGKGKGVLDVLYAMHALRARGLPVSIIFVGPPQFKGDWEAVLDLRQSLGLQDLAEFVGPKSMEEVAGFYRRCDFLVLASHFEGLPITFIEAGAFGLPVIGTPVGAVAELLRHEANALLVEPESVIQLASGIERLVRSAGDRERFGRQLRADVAAFHPDTVCRSIALAIEQTVNPSRHSSTKREAKVQS